MTEEKKPRKRLTLTDMIEVVDELYVATLPEEEQEGLGYCSVLLQKEKGESDDDSEYIAVLMTHDKDGNQEEVCRAVSGDNYEAAVARLLADVTKLLEDHKKKLLAELDSVVDRHKRTIRSARTFNRKKE